MAAVPEVGQLVRVRERRYVVTDVRASGLDVDARRPLDLSGIQALACGVAIRGGERVRSSVEFPLAGPTERSQSAQG